MGNVISRARQESWHWVKSKKNGPINYWLFTLMLTIGQENRVIYFWKMCMLTNLSVSRIILLHLSPMEPSKVNFLFLVYVHESKAGQPIFPHWGSQIVVQSLQSTCTPLTFACSDRQRVPNLQKCPYVWEGCSVTVLDRSGRGVGPPLSWHFIVHPLVAPHSISRSSGEGKSPSY